ncbi:MAG: carboxypeptidase regulatory-like domain-containing protein [Bacteroidales bacterium]|nr:carboxypeptidase regulatory-like domain-containing protein [Candidatus Colimorpha merdihippi]
MSKTIKGLFVVFFAVLFSATAMAQSTTSSIAGHVTDANGALQDAMVTAIYTPSGVVYHAFTNRDGSYRINGVIAGGPYTIKIEMMGHQTLVAKGFMAPLANTLVYDPVLKIEANTLEEVVITAEGVNNNMNIQNSGAGTHIGAQMVENLPTTSRSMNDIMKLTPQASVVGGGFAAGGGNYRGSAVTVDGASFNNAFGIGSNLPGGGSPLALDAIDQITVNLTPFDVRQSGFQGSAINVVTKQGSNQWHGSLYNYYSSNATRGIRVDTNSLSNSDVLNNVIGMTLSGPIIKDKLFFFVNAEYTIDNVAGSTRQARESESDVYSGATSYNRPTVDQMETMRNFLIQNYNYDPGRYQNYSLSTPDYKLLARLDWNINANNKFNLRFSHTHNYGSYSPSSSMSPIGGTNTTFNIGGTEYTVNRNSQGRQSDYALFFESARYYQEQNFTSLAAELNSRLFDGKGANTLRATWSYQNEPRSHYGDFFPTVDILEPYTDANGETQYAMFTTFGLDPFTYSNLRRVNTINVTDEISYTMGRHNFVAGAQFETNRIVNGFMQGGAGWYIFESWEAFANNSNPLSFMITHANTNNPTETVYPTYDYSQASLYAQDEIEFSRYFKLTAGLRLEMPFVNFPNNNLNKDFAAIAEANPESSFAGLSTADLPGTTLNVSPRLGFNWDVTKDRKVIVRGGTGLFTGRIPNVWLVSAAGNSNCLQYQYIANLQTGNPVMPFAADRSDIINSIYAGEAFHQQDLAAPTSTTILAKDLRMPTSWKTSAAVDVKLPFGIKGTLEGIYSYNYNEVVATTLGYTMADTLTLPGESETRTTYASENIKNSSNGKMSGYYLHNDNNLHGQYYSITAQLAKHFGFGLDIMAAYTRSFSSSLTDGTGDQVYNIAQISNVRGDNSPELGYSYYVAPNRLIANASYTIYEGRRTATKLGLFYEGTNLCYVGSYTQARYSYTMKTDQNTSISAPNLVYIPTADELSTMQFSSDENRAAFEEFITNDPYLSAHRGEYSKRNGAVAPWVNRINFKVDQEIYFNVAGRQTTLEIGADVNNLLNLFNSSWGCYKQLSSEQILNLKNGKYTFTEPAWNSYNDFVSTWSLLLHVRYSF